MLIMAIGYGLDPNEPLPKPGEVVGLVLFPFGFCFGLLVAWRWPLVGGALSLICAIVFLISMQETDLIGIIFFLSLPAVLFVVYGIMLRTQGDKTFCE